jgi:hypothetical protein
MAKGQARVSSFHTAQPRACLHSRDPPLAAQFLRLPLAPTNQMRRQCPLLSGGTVWTTPGAPAW